MIRYFIMKKIPIVTIIGWSNTGKTTLVCDLIRDFKNRGLRPAALKRTPEPVALDSPGTDSWNFAQNGAFSAGLATPEGCSFHFSDFELTPESLFRLFYGADIIICEGLKLPGYPIIQTAGKITDLSELKGDPQEWTAVVTDSPVLESEIETSRYQGHG